MVVLHALSIRASSAATRDDKQIIVIRKSSKSEEYKDEEAISVNNADIVCLAQRKTILLLYTVWKCEVVFIGFLFMVQIKDGN